MKRWQGCALSSIVVFTMLRYMEHIGVQSMKDRYVIIALAATWTLICNFTKQF